LGYTIWYAALKYLSVTRAALVQLCVPAMAAAGGVIFLGESVREARPSLAPGISICLGTTANVIFMLVQDEEH
jgi:hypothetical protein